MTDARCRGCGAPLTYAGRGRPRTHCTVCIPPGQGAEAIRAWRRIHGAELNARRCVAYAADPMPQRARSLARYYARKESQQ